MSHRVSLAVALALTVSLPILAVNTKFPDFTPLTASAGPLPIYCLNPRGA